MPVVYDASGGVSFGALVDVPYGPPQDGLKFEALFSHERSWIEVQGPSLFDPKTRVDVTVDHLMVGGVQELDTAPGARSSAAWLGSAASPPPTKWISGSPSA